MSHYFNQHFFSWHEIGIHDLAENIDFILEYTKQPSLFYIGHSMGGTTFTVLMSERPEYNEKVKLAQLFSPGVLNYYVKSGLLLAAAQLSNFWLVSISCPYFCQIFLILFSNFT